MRGLAIACLTSLVPLLAGCSVMKQVTENVIFEKRLYLSDCRLEKRIAKDAEDVLREVCNRHAIKVFSKDFRKGFDDGYRDFLTFGGPIRPPAQAPPHYRTAQYLSPEGHCQVREYFLGFQYGAEVAQSTGRRQFFTHLVLMTDPPPPMPLDITVIPPPPDAVPTDPSKEAPMAPMKEAAPAPVPTSGGTEIHGIVYVDLDASGVPNVGEPRLAGNTVQLLLNGAVFKSTVTDANGAYVFAMVPIGSYVVCAVPQSGYSQITPTWGVTCAGGLGYPADVTIWDPNVIFDGLDFGCLSAA